MKKIGLTLLIVTLLFVGFILFRTYTFSSKQLIVDPAIIMEIDDSAKFRFANAIKIKTISFEDQSKFDSTAFDSFILFLEKSFPLVHENLHKKSFNEYGLLYEWKGKQNDQKPIILLGHIDVVPVSDSEIGSWKYPPFSGKIVEGVVWGRGTIDDKVSVMGVLEATEMLLKEGFEPSRTIYLAFGHDEENLGKFGASTIASYLRNQGVKAEFVLDEGYSIVNDLIPGMKKPVALIGIAEKGYVSLKFSVDIEGGHSSMPRNETSIDVLSNAINELRGNPFDAEFSIPMEHFASFLGPEMPFMNKMAFANSGIFKSMIISTYEKSASGNALLRTTVSPTIFTAGDKENIIPRHAEATFNFRIIPGETVKSVLEKVKLTVRDKRVEVTPYQNGTDPSMVSDINTDGFRNINKTIREIFQETLVAPNLVIAATDSRYYKEVTDNIYRFAPFILNPDNLSSFHGVNERLPVSEYENAVRFYRQLILNCNQQ